MRRRVPAFALCVACTILPGAPKLHASPEAAAPPLDVVSAHLAAREATLTRQHQAAHALAQQHAWLTYRLGRRRALGFFANTQKRPQQAQAAAMSFEVLGRSLQEAQKLADERARVRQERVALERQSQWASATPTPAASPPKLIWPSKGPVISGPGLRMDAVTKVVLRDPGVQILARVDAPVVCPADASVTRVEPLPSGGYAVVLAHEDGSVSVLSGLRMVEVSRGDRVPAGHRLGRVGRTLDGAPVVRMAVWQSGQPVDPRPAPVRR